MAIPQFVGTNSAIQSTASASITCNYPTASKSGDLVIVSVEFTNTSAGVFTVTTPTNWTLVESSDQSTGVGRFFATYYRFRGAETSVTITSSKSATQFALAQIQAYKGDIDQVNPIDAHASTYSAASGATAHTLPSVTATQSDFAMAGFYHAEHTTTTTAWTTTWNTNMWEQLDTGASLNSRYHVISNATEYGLYGSGATGTRTVNSSISTVQRNYMVTLAIKSPQTGPTNRGVNTTVNGGTASANLASSYPSGDFFICCTEFRKSTAGAFTVSCSDTNWSLIASEDHSASDGTRLDVWAGWRVGGTTSVTMTASTGTDMFGMSNIIAIPDDGHAIDKTEPYGDVQIVYGNTSSTTIDIPSSTTTVPMSYSHLVAMSWMATAQTAFTHSWPFPPWHAPGYSAEQTTGCATIGRQMGHATAGDYHEVAQSTGIETVTMTQTCNPRYGVRVIIQPPHPNLKPSADTGSGAETASLTAQTSASDTGSGADLAGTVLVGGAADAAACADSATVIVVASGDTATGTDTAALAVAIPDNDTAAGVDTASIAVAVQGIDTGSGTDTATVKIAPTTDSGTGVDNAVTLIGTDAGSGTDSATQRVYDTDIGTAADTAFVSQAVIQNDSATGTETAAVIVVNGDTGVGTEFAVPFGTDTGTGTDTATVKIAGAETGTGTEAAGSTNAAQTADTGTGTDTAAVVVVATGDTGSGVESAVGFGSDTGTSAEASTLRVTATDTGVGVDTANAMNLATSADTGSSIDNAIVTPTVTTDTGAGADLASLNAKANAADVVSGGDNAVVIVQGAVDSGSGADNSKLVMAVADTGSGVDNGAIAVFVFGVDTAGGSDTALVRIPSGDTGSGTESSTKTINGFLQAPRMTIVQPESRTATIERESRGISVDGETRLVVIGFELLRTIKVDAEDRNVIIYPET